MQVPPKTREAKPVKRREMDAYTRDISIDFNLWLFSCLEASSTTLCSPERCCRANCYVDMLRWFAACFFLGRHCGRQMWIRISPNQDHSKHVDDWLLKTNQDTPGTPLSNPNRLYFSALFMVTKLPLAIRACIQASEMLAWNSPCFGLILTIATCNPVEF